MKQIPDRSEVRAVLMEDGEAAYALDMRLRRTFQKKERIYVWLYRSNEHFGGEAPASFLVERNFDEIHAALDAQFGSDQLNRAS